MNRRKDRHALTCHAPRRWVVPLVWLPIFVGVQAYCASALGVSMAALLCWLLVGVLAWQGLEYAIHRWVFHANLTSYWGITFHFLFHGCHHKYPMDGQRLVGGVAAKGRIKGIQLIAPTKKLPAFAGAVLAVVLQVGVLSIVGAYFPPQLQLCHAGLVGPGRGSGRVR